MHLHFLTNKRDLIIKVSTQVYSFFNQLKKLFLYKEYEGYLKVYGGMIFPNKIGFSFF